MAKTWWYVSFLVYFCHYHYLTQWYLIYTQYMLLLGSLINFLAPLSFLEYYLHNKMDRFIYKIAYTFICPHIGLLCSTNFISLDNWCLTQLLSE